MDTIFARPPEPPACIEIEQGLLGIVLFAPAVLAKLPDIAAEDFFDPMHAAIWEAVLSLQRHGQNIDPLAVLEYLRPRWTDHPAMRQNLIDCMADYVASVVTVHSAPHYATRIRDLSSRRWLADAGRRLTEQAMRPDRDETAAQIGERFVAEIAGSAEPDGMIDGHDVVARILDAIDRPRCIDSTGYPRLDGALAGGFHRHRFYGFGARMKVGKSTFLASISYNMAMAGIPHAYLCLESSPEEIVQGMAARHIKTNRLEFLKPELRPWVAREFYGNQDFLKGKGLRFYGRPRMSLDALAATIAKLGARGKVRGIIVDYLQLVTGKDGRISTAEHLDNVAQTLAEMVKSYDLWIACAFQLNRDNETRGGDGLMMACDLAMNMHRLEIADHDDEIWLEMTATRYTENVQIGDETEGAYRLNRQHGPYFEEIAR